MFRPSLGHHQVVFTSLKNTVHEVEVVIVMTRSHSSCIFLVNLLGLKVVYLVVLGFGCGVVERIGRCSILLWVLNISCSVSPVLCVVFRLTVTAYCITFRTQWGCHTLKLYKLSLGQTTL